MKTRHWLIIVTATLVLGSASQLSAITLQEALQQTVEKNPEIQNAKHDLEKACGRRLVFRSIGLPDVVLGAAGGDQGGYRAGEKPNQPFGFGFGGLTQPLFNAAVPASFRRGDIEVLIAKQQLNMAMVTQLYNARVSYYTGAFNRQLKQLTKEQRVHLAGNESTQQARYQTGVAQRGALLSAEMQTRELDPQIEATDRAYQGAALSLADTMGDDLTGRFPLPEMESELKYSAVPVDLSSATTLALNNRADIKLARLMVKSAAEDERIMEAAYYPVVNGLLQGEYIPVSGVRRQSEGSVHRSDDIISSELREGAAYTWRVVDNGKVTGQVRQARSAREINEILLKKMESDVPRDLARLQTSLDAINKNYESISRAIASAQESVTLVTENVSGGLSSQLESRLAENASLETRTTLLNLAYQQNLALAELDRVTGRYFQYSDDPSANMQKVP
jgi:outer membrane protein TolC